MNYSCYYWDRELNVGMNCNLIAFEWKCLIFIELQVLVLHLWGEDSLILPIISLASCRGQFCASAKYILSIAELEQQPISSTSPQRWLPQRSTFPSSRSVRQSITPSLRCCSSRNAIRITPWDCGGEQRQRGLWTGQ